MEPIIKIYFIAAITPSSCQPGLLTIVSGTGGHQLLKVLHQPLPCLLQGGSSCAAVDGGLGVLVVNPHQEVSPSGVRRDGYPGRGVSRT